MKHEAFRNPLSSKIHTPGYGIELQCVVGVSDLERCSADGKFFTTTWHDEILYYQSIGAVLLATMLPAVGVHLRDLYSTTVEFITLRSNLFFLGRRTTGYLETSRLMTFLIDPCTALIHLRYRSDNSQESLDCSACPPHSSAPPSPCLSMRRASEASKAEFTRSRIEITNLEERCKLLESTLQETKELLRMRDEEVEKLKNSLSRSDRRRSDGDQKQRLQAIENGLALGRHQMGLNRRQGKKEEDEGQDIAQSMSILQEQSAHTRSLEIFLTKTDQWSGAQVIQAVHDLNCEILQFAASASEICTFDRSPRKAPTQGAQDIIPRLGQKLSRMLATRDHAQDPILAQLALQGCISIFISTALSSFCIGLQKQSNNVLSTIYLHIASTGESRVCPQVAPLNLW
jgi:hypothetical protein